MNMITAQMVKDLRERTGAGMLDCRNALKETNGDIDAAIDWLREKGISKAAKKSARIAAEGLAEVVIDGNHAVILEVNSETDFVAKNEEFQQLVQDLAKVALANDFDTASDVLKLDMDGKTVEEEIVAKTAKIGEKLSLRRIEKLTKTDTQVFGRYVHMGGKIVVLTLLDGTTEEVANDVAMHAAAMNPSYVKIADVPEDVVEHERGVLTEQAINEGKPAEIAEKMVNGRIHKFFKEICLEEQPFVKDGDITVYKYVENHGGKIVTAIRYEVGEGMEKREENFAEEVMNQLNQN